MTTAGSTDAAHPADGARPEEFSEVFLQTSVFCRMPAADHLVTDVASRGEARP